MTRTIIDKDDRSGYVAIEYDGRTDMKKITDLEWIVKKRNRTNLKKITDLEWIDKEKELNRSEENNKSGKKFVGNIKKLMVDL